jgi:hypothetical protein
MFSYKSLVILGLASMVGLVSCKKSYLDRQSSTEVSIEDAFKTTTGVRAAINGLHRTMYEARDDNQFGQRSIDLMNDLMGADMPITANGAGWFIGAYNYTDHRQAGGTAGYTWGYYFRIINNANQILANVDNAQGPQEEKDNLKGQALFYRAFAYYNLSIYYQFTYRLVDVDLAPGLPIYTAPTRDGAPRGTLRQTYERIVADLDEAVALLGDGGPRPDKSQVDGSVAKGLYARVALVMQNWSKAAQMASEARQAYSYMQREQLLSGFNSLDNNEWMWGSRLQADQTSNTFSFISHMVLASGGYAALGMQKAVARGNEGTYDFITASDVRKDWWFPRLVPEPFKSQGYAPYSQRKYSLKIPGTFITDVCYMRASEMALIEAEARANVNQLSQAADIMNELIQIRDTSYTAPAARTALINNILLQRRIELWGEGFAFSDIMRLQAYDDAIISVGVKGLHRGTGHNPTLAGRVLDVVSGSTQFLFRIPGSELENNKAFTGADQNP